MSAVKATESAEISDGLLVRHTAIPSNNHPLTGLIVVLQASDVDNLFWGQHAAWRDCSIRCPSFEALI
jgi:hypothetical protein